MAPLLHRAAIINGRKFVGLSVVNRPTVVTCSPNKSVGHNQRRCNIVSMVYISMVIMDSAAGQIPRSTERISSSL